MPAAATVICTLFQRTSRLMSAGMTLSAPRTVVLSDNKPDAEFNLQCAGKREQQGRVRAVIEPFSTEGCGRLALQ